MMVRKLFAGAVLIALAGCQSVSVPSLFPQPAPPPAPAISTPTAPAPAEPLVWGRKDCQRAANNPTIQASFGNDKGYCEKQSNSKEGDGVSMALVSCMDTRGYRYGTRAEHDAACARLASSKASGRR